MKLRITKVDEYQFLTCYKHGLWGSKSNRFKNWESGELLAFIVEKRMVALGEVSGEAYYSEEIVWDNGLFPYRIPIRFVHIIPFEYRIPVLGQIRDTFTNAWGANYGLGILNQLQLLDENANIIVKEIKKQPNAIENYRQNLDAFLLDAKQKREVEIEEEKTKKRRKRRGESAENNLNSVDKQDDNVSSNQLETFEEESNHSKAQHMLINMGKITGCSVWIASNDKNRQYKGHALGESCLDKLPNFGLNKEATDKISLIDIIWIQQNSPICAFEVETTTSIYSGLLRMSDLISVVPALNIKLYIVAPRERQEKVMKELRRPTFKKIGLNDYCKFIALEDLGDLLDKIKGLYGHVQPTVVDKISIEAETEVD